MSCTVFMQPELIQSWCGIDVGDEIQNYFKYNDDKFADGVHEILYDRETSVSMIFKKCKNEINVIGFIRKG